jgi:hypothetical protein
MLCFQFDHRLIGGGQSQSFHAVVHRAEAWDIYRVHTSGQLSATINILISALKARMHKPDEDSEVQQGTDRGFYVRGGCKLCGKIRYNE